MTDLVCSTKPVKCRAFQVTARNIRKPETWPSWIFVAMLRCLHEKDHLSTEDDDDRIFTVVAGVRVDPGDYIVLRGSVDDPLEVVCDDAFTEGYTIHKARR